MKLYRRCNCGCRCGHPYWYRFWLHGGEHRGSTHTDNRTLAQRIAARHQSEVLEGRYALRRPRTPKLSDHIKVYTEWTAKTNRSSNKDPGILASFLRVVGDRRLEDFSPFHVERWKTARAKEVKPATVNRELNIVRGLFLPSGGLGPPGKLSDERCEAV